MITPHLPWKFHANRSSRFLVILLTKKQRNKERKKKTKKEIERKQYPAPGTYRGRGKYYEAGADVTGVGGVHILRNAFFKYWVAWLRNDEGVGLAIKLSWVRFPVGPLSS